jgi:hypothetical protein
LQPHGLAGPIFFCALLGVSIALVQGPGRHRHLDLCEQGAPLFGRELARAKALTPCIAVTFAALAYWGAQIASGVAVTPISFVLALAAVLASTLVALSATIRTGSARALYVALACASAAIAYAFAAFVSYVAIELAFCALVSFLALRQYGEALARYDPV